MPDRAPPPSAAVRHRCGATNFSELSGPYGRLQGESGVNGKFRARFVIEDGTLRAWWVPGGHDRYALVAQSVGPDAAVFAEPGEGRRARVWATITPDCRLEAQWGWRGADGREEKSVEPPSLYVPFPELAKRDFEPCTEILHLGGASRSWAAAQRVVASDAPTPVSSSTITVAAWSDSVEIATGCVPSFDVWTDGQALDVRGATSVETTEGRLRWHLDYENAYLGVHGLALHRKVTCGTDPPVLLGVACVQVDVR